MTARLPDLVHAVAAALRMWAEGLDDVLRAAFAELNATSGVGAADGANVYLRVLSQPVLLLPAWLGEGLPDATVVDVLGSALAGYLAVRLQDDWIDEGRGDPATAMLLATALLARHTALVGQHMRDGRYWQLHGQLWLRYAEAMAFERRLAAGHGAYDDAAFDRVLQRSEPLLLPAAALLLLADRWHELGVLTALVQATVRAHQHFDDLRDALDDFGRGQRTWLAARSGAADGNGLMAWLLRGGAEAVLAAAEADLAVARSAALTLQLPPALAWLDARGMAMRQWQQRLVAGYLARILAGPAPS